MKGILLVVEYFGETYCSTLLFVSVNYSLLQCSLQKLKVKGCEKAAVHYFTNFRQRALLLFIQTQTSKHQEYIHQRTIFMADDSYVSMVSEILPCHNDLWCLWWVDFLELFISKYCYQIYGILKYIANISGLTALARYRSGALFLEGFDH